MVNCCLLFPIQNLDKCLLPAAFVHGYAGDYCKSCCLVFAYYLEVPPFKVPFFLSASLELVGIKEISDGLDEFWGQYCFVLIQVSKLGLIYHKGLKVNLKGHQVKC